MTAGEPGPETLPALLHDAARRWGDAPAIASSNGTIGYRDLQAAARRLAAGLVAAGAGKGTRIALLAGNTPFWIEALFACAEIGALVTPISTLATPAELAHILRHSDAALLLAARRYVGRDYGATIAEALPSLTAADEPMRLAEAPFLRQIWIDEPDGIAGAGALADLVARGGRDPALGHDFIATLSAGVTPGEDAVVIYTSGSTADPKAVIHTHGGMTRHACVLAGIHFARPGERVLCVLPMFWVGGLGMLLETFAIGGCIVLPDGVSPGSVVEALGSIGADLLHGWPAQRRTIRALAETAGVAVASVRGLRDERLADGSLRRPEQAPNQLGMTESFGPHCGAPVGTVLPYDRLGAFGPPIGGGERRVVDPPTGTVLAPGETGELQLRGGALMRGHYKAEAAAVFTADGWFATGDLVRIDAEGYLFFAGRMGDMLKTRGANVSRLEVEAALRALPGVEEAVVCGLPDAELGQRIVAAVVAPGLDEATVRTELAALIASYKVPSDVLLIDRSDLVWAGSGKIRVPEIAALIEARLSTRQGMTPPL